MTIKDILTTYTIAGIIAISSIFEASGVSAYPGKLKVTLESGESIECRLVGDEYCHQFVSGDGYILKPTGDQLFKKTTERFSPEELDRERSVASREHRLPGNAFPTIGDVKGVILLVEFADNQFGDGHDASLFTSVMNQEGFSEQGFTGSARDYFIDQSQGLFTPAFDVYGPIKLSKTLSYYGTNGTNGEDAHAADMVVEATSYASETLGVDFSQYDYNDDGQVDFVYLIYAGYAESYGASPSTIWPHASDIELRGYNCEVNGKKVGKYACSSELKYISGDTLEGIGTFCHEFSHILGQADHYNTRYPSDIQMGYWDVMDQGNYNNESRTPAGYSAFERELLGWGEITELTEPSESVEIPSFASNNISYRIMTKTEGEYFTLENRQPEGWDTYLPGHGLMIIHVAYDQSAWDGNYVNSGIIKRYDLVEADGTQGATQSTDLFPIEGRDIFTDYSTPNSLSWAGEPTEKGISEIVEHEDGRITFRFMMDRHDTPVALFPSEVGSDFFVACWEQVESARSYSIDVKETLSIDENPIRIKETFEGMTEGTYPNALMQDISSEIDEYTMMPGWSGQNLYQAGGELMIGAYATSGILKTPQVDLSTNSGVVTVAVKIHSYPGKSVNYTMTLLNNQGGVIATKKDKATKTETDVIWHVENCSDATKLSITTDNERLFINDLRLLSGEIEDDNVWTCGPRDLVIDNIESTQYRIEGLLPNHLYKYTVKVSASDGYSESLASDEIEVTTSGTSNVAQMTDRSEYRYEYFDLTGRKIQSLSSGGVYIRAAIDKFGNRQTSKIIYICK